MTRNQNEIRPNFLSLSDVLLSDTEIRSVSERHKSNALVMLGSQKHCNYKRHIHTGDVEASTVLKFLWGC